MNKINLITFPDRIYSDALTLLLIHPSAEMLNELQYDIFPTVNVSMNIYVYDKAQYARDEVDWLLGSFTQADTAIVCIDSCSAHVRDLLSYFIAKPKTYWLTNATDTVYSHISGNRIYNLSMLSNLGGIIEDHEE